MPELMLTDVALIRSSGLFKEDWYLAHNPDVADAKLDPLLHYLRHGGFEGRDPSPKFSSAWYLDTYKDIRGTGMNPLIHYLKYGRAERLNQCIMALGTPWGHYVHWLESRGQRRTIRIKFKSNRLWIRLNTTDVTTIYTVFGRQEYRMGASAPPSCIIDAGAYTGLSPIYFARRYPTARIIAIEPVPANYELLIRNTSKYPQIITVNKALWYEAAQVDMYDYVTGHNAYSVIRGKGTPLKKVARVETVTLDDIIREFGISSIDLLKVDVEGAEREIFEHSRTWIGRVDAIAVELHDHIEEGCNRAFQAATQDFTLEWRGRETVFKARHGASLGPA